MISPPFSQNRIGIDKKSMKVENILGNDGDNDVITLSFFIKIYYSKKRHRIIAIFSGLNLSRLVSWPEIVDDNEVFYGL